MKALKPFFNGPIQGRMREQENLRLLSKITEINVRKAPRCLQLNHNRTQWAQSVQKMKNRLIDEKNQDYFLNLAKAKSGLKSKSRNEENNYLKLPRLNQFDDGKAGRSIKVKNTIEYNKPKKIG